MLNSRRSVSGQLPNQDLGQVLQLCHHSFKPLSVSVAEVIRASELSLAAQCFPYYRVLSSAKYQSNINTQQHIIKKNRYVNID